MNDSAHRVRIVPVPGYDNISGLSGLITGMIRDLAPFRTVLLKPNWVKESHIKRPEEWEQVITHPAVISAVVEELVRNLAPGSKIIITDGPQTDSSFEKIIVRYPVEHWKKTAAEKGITLEILDLRDDEWIQENDIITSRRKLPGDPKGSTEVNLKGGLSEFHGHRKSSRGYYGADYNLKETNRAHDGVNNLYRVSRTVIEADMFINLPKLKTHKKAGITCCLKNLVGINTYKNFLPHHSEGGPSENGDQFPGNNFNAAVEGPFLAFAKQHILRNPSLAKLIRPFSKTGRAVFGKTENTVRSGNWYGNDTLWRMTLDLNKVLLYANPDGSLREASWVNAKKYIGIVDGIIAGEGNGPLTPDAVNLGYIIAGTNPVAIDAVCATLMGFDPLKVPAILHAFDIKHYPVCDFPFESITAVIEDTEYGIRSIPGQYIRSFKPHFGWIGHIESGETVV
jgi:uncharacterized protein (DUF362 family)